MLLDIDLGAGIDGPETARRILARWSVPIVFLTSHSEEDYVERVREISGYGYVIKGSGEFILASSIRMALQLFAAHEKAQRRERQIASVFRAAPIGIGVAEGRRLIDANTAYLEMVGYSADEVFGRDSRLTFPSDAEYERIGRIRAKLIEESGGYGTFETQLRRKDGALRDVRMSFAPIDPDNPTGPVTFIDEDITATKKHEPMIRSILHTIPDFLFYIAFAGYLREFFGGTTDDLIAPPTSLSINT